MITEFDKTEVYEREIQPLIEKASQLMAEHDIPHSLLMQYANTEDSDHIQHINHMGRERDGEPPIPIDCNACFYAICLLFSEDHDLEGGLNGTGLFLRSQFMEMASEMRRKVIAEFAGTPHTLDA